MRASGTEKVECVKLLLDRGAQVNMQDTVSARSVIAYYDLCGMLGVV